jgi:hypothetical protein
MGGKDTPDNIIELTPKQHAKAHLDLYKKYGKQEDLCAYYLLSKDPRGPQILSSLGGKVQGKKNKESGHMQRISKALTKEQRILFGKMSAKKCKELQTNAFFDPKIRSKICILGGKAQGKINAENGHLKTIANEYWDKVKSGKTKRKKRVWIYSDKLKKSFFVEKPKKLPKGFKYGRKYK